MDNHAQWVNDQIIIAAWAGLHIVPGVGTSEKAVLWYRYPWPLAGDTATYWLNTHTNKLDCDHVREHIKRKALTDKYLEYLKEEGGKPDDEFGEAVSKAFLKVIKYKCSQFEWVKIKRDDGKVFQRSIPKEEVNFYFEPNGEMYMDTTLRDEHGSRLFAQVKHTDYPIWTKGWRYLSDNFPERYMEAVQLYLDYGYGI